MTKPANQVSRDWPLAEPFFFFSAEARLLCRKKMITSGRTCSSSPATEVSCVSQPQPKSQLTTFIFPWLPLSEKTHCSEVFGDYYVLPEENWWSSHSPITCWRGVQYHSWIRNEANTYSESKPCIRQYHLFRRKGHHQNMVLHLTHSHAKVSLWTLREHFCSLHVLCNISSTRCSRGRWQGLLLFLTLMVES